MTKESPSNQTWFNVFVFLFIILSLGMHYWTGEDNISLQNQIYGLESEIDELKMSEEERAQKERLMEFAKIMSELRENQTQRFNPGNQSFYEGLAHPEVEVEDSFLWIR